ncbi:hypothetical protein [Brevibacillus sp. NRS-1366]|uniref:hypothetical protein n=1 Tax=Brevibacillus sp. NRS-1366 TaxID=3233899 RepID=UPI003D1DE9AC
METKLENWIIEADISNMQAAMEAGSFRSEDLVQVYLERICKYDSVLHSIIEINPTALEIARVLDEEPRARSVTGFGQSEC